MKTSVTDCQKHACCRGASLIEVLILMAVVLIASGIALMNVRPAVRAAHVDDAYQMTLGQMRLARQIAMDKRTVCIVAFGLPGTISVTPAFADGTAVVTTTVQIPQDVSFTVIPGIPTTVASTPDGLGSGRLAIDFDQVAGGGGTAIYFQPDGSAQDAVGRVNDGVVYIAQPGQLMTSRAVTLLGTTGRVHGYRLVSAGVGKVAWQ